MRLLSNRDAAERQGGGTDKRNQVLHGLSLLCDGVRVLVVGLGDALPFAVAT